MSRKLEYMKRQLQKLGISDEEIEVMLLKLIFNLPSPPEKGKLYPDNGA